MLKKAFGSILVRNSYFEYLTENFDFLKRNFQAKIGFILLAITDRLPMVKYSNLPITGVR